MAGRLAPDVIVMDVNMAKLDGIEATRRVKARWPEIVVVGLSVSTRAQVEPLLLEAGASGYVSKEAAGDQLYGAIDMAVQPNKLAWHSVKRDNAPQMQEPPV
jgi:DNA-binding NarL/FixJ family response regulator